MLGVITISVLAKTAGYSETAFDIDKKPFGMAYPMGSVSERQFAYNKYNRWFKNSVSLKTDKVMPQLNEMVLQALTTKKLVLESEHHNHISHVDVILDYLENEFERRGYCAKTNRAEVQP